MRVARRCAAVVVGVLVATGSVFVQGTTWHFDDLPAGQVPAGLVFGGAPEHKPAPWVVLRDGTNGVLAHARQGDTGSQVAVVEQVSIANVALSTRLRFADGVGSAGLVWRYYDPSNYHVAVMDLVAQDVRIYRVSRGNRTRLENEDDLELDPTAWQTLKVEQVGTRIRVWINGVPVASARDRAPQAPGAVGVWSAGDASAWFDDLRAEPLPESERNNRLN